MVIFSTAAFVYPKMNEIPNDLTPLPTMPWPERPTELPLVVEECRTALWRCRGNITRAAELLKVPSQRLRNFVRNSQFLLDEQREAHEQLVDIAEDNLYDALTDDVDTSRRDTASWRVLQSLGAERGFAKSTAGVNLNLPGKGKFTITWEDGTPIHDPKTIDVTPNAEAAE